MAWENFDEERLKQIIRQFDGNVTSKNKFLVKPSKIECKGHRWYLCPSKRKHIKVNCGIKIYVVDYELDELDRVLAYDGNNLLAIPLEEIVDLGFN
jgi:hypothetical protein